MTPLTVARRAPNEGGLARAFMAATLAPVILPPAQSPTMTLPGVARLKLPGKLSDAC
jgi:hypothetical protein